MATTMPDMSYHCQAYAVQGMGILNRPRENAAMSKHDVGTVDEVLGRAVASIRKRLSLTQVGVAQGAEMEQAQLSRMESGKHTITSSRLVAIAKAMCIAPSDIWRVAEGELGIRPAELPAPKEDARRAGVPVADGADQASLAAVHAVIHSIITYLASTRLEDVGTLRASLETVPEAYRQNGLGASVLKAVSKAEAAILERAKPSASQGASRPGSRPKK